MEMDVLFWSIIFDIEPGPSFCEIIDPAQWPFPWQRLVFHIDLLRVVINIGWT